MVLNTYKAGKLHSVHRSVKLSLPQYLENSLRNFLPGSGFKTALFYHFLANWGHQDIKVLTFVLFLISSLNTFSICSVLKMGVKHQGLGRKKAVREPSPTNTAKVKFEFFYMSANQ